MAEKQETVYLQAFVRCETEAQVAEWAARIGHSSTRMAAFLIQCALDDQDFIIKAASSKVMKAVKKHVNRATPPTLEKPAKRKVKLQIPVPQATADQVESLAKRFDRSQAWLTAELLEEAVEDRANVFRWLAVRFMGLTVATPIREVGKAFAALEALKRQKAS